MSDVDKLPRWLKPVNRVLVALQRRGLALGPTRVLSVPGRKSGEIRTTPVSPLVVGGRRYVVGGSAQADWVKNARAAGWGVLAHGREEERVRLVELVLEERGPILREFPKKVPGGIPFFRRMYELPKDKEALLEAFAALAPRCAVFRLEDEKIT
ncbi:MAG TPA: nitroreductase/quinone reductase family protein [Rubrobacteraceae bacterium]|nr:nitroreductase/quinone reductase family protein [Rubrobacteraceae bacterium]